MRRYFSGLCITGLLLTWLLALAAAYPQDTQKQRNKRSKPDTTSDTRLQRSNMPPLHKTDSLPVPVPPTPPPVPLPDTLPKK